MTAHLQECLQATRLTPRGDENVEKLCVAGEDAKWYSCYGKTWQFLKNTPAVCLRNPTFRYLTKKNENMCL